MPPLPSFPTDFSIFPPRLPGRRLTSSLRLRFQPDLLPRSLTPCLPRRSLGLCNPWTIRRSYPKISKLSAKRLGKPFQTSRPCRPFSSPFNWPLQILQAPPLALRRSAPPSLSLPSILLRRWPIRRPMWCSHQARSPSPPLNRQRKAQRQRKAIIEGTDVPVAYARGRKYNYLPPGHPSPIKENGAARVQAAA